MVSFASTVSRPIATNSIECGLLVLHEPTIEATARALMSGVAASDRKTARQRRLVSNGLIADRLPHGSV